MANRSIITALAILLLASAPAFAVDTIKATETKADYLQDGLVVGGNGTVKNVLVTGIRRSPTGAGEERTVIDLKTPNQRAPYFQADVSSIEKRIVLSIHGAKYDTAFANANATRLFAKSQHISNAITYPNAEDDIAVMEFVMKKTASVSIFYLANPPRIIIDSK